MGGVPSLLQIVWNISTKRRLTRKSVDCREWREETSARTAGQIYATFRRLTRDERSSRIKNRRRARRPVRSLLPAVRAVTGVFREFQSGVKIGGVLSLLRSLSPRAYSYKKKVGVMPWKQCYCEQKGHLPLCRMLERRMLFTDEHPQELRRSNQRISLGAVQNPIDNNLITLPGWDGY